MYKVNSLYLWLSITHTYFFTLTLYSGSIHTEVNMLIDIGNIFEKSQYNKWYSYISQRYSCRNFKGTADILLINKLRDFLQSFQLNGVKVELISFDDLNLNKFLFKLPFFIKSPYYILIKTDELIDNNPNLFSGLIGEAIVLEAQSLGLSSCWCGFLSALSGKKNQPPSESLNAIIAIGESEDSSKKSANKKQLNKISVNSPYEWNCNWAFNVAEAIRNAPSAFNSQPWLLSYIDRTLTIKMNSLNSLESGIVMLHALCAFNNTPLKISLSGEKYIFIQETKGEI